MNLPHEIEAKKRQKVMTFRLSPEEYNQLKEDADSLGITTSAYIRQTLLDAPVPKAARKPSIDRQMLGKLLSQIGRVGNNINQLAKDKNSGIAIQSQNLARALDDWHELQQAILAALNPSFKPKTEPEMTILESTNYYPQNQVKKEEKTAIHQEIEENV